MHALIFRACHQLSIPDFDARAFFPERDETALIQARLTDALGLLQRFAPIRYTHLRRDLPRILVGVTNRTAECLARVGICLVAFDYVVHPATTPARLALTLVHEGTHARLDRAGFEYRLEQRHRIERLCVTAEVVVARRLPDSESLLPRLDEKLTRPPAFWSNEAFDERTLTAVRALGWYGKPLAAMVAVVQRIKRRKESRAA